MRFSWSIGLLLCALPAHAQLAGTAALKPQPTVKKAASTTTRVAVAAAAEPVGSPVIGYAARTDGTAVYSLQGFPGAAFPGPRLALARAAGRPVVSSTGGYALARGERAGEVLMYGLRPKAGSGMLLPSAYFANVEADQIAVSPLGRAFLVYDRERRELEVFAGLPGRPFSIYTASLAGVPGVLTALAVSDDGAVALAAFSGDNGTGEIYALRRGTPAMRAAAVSRVVHVSFVPNTRNGLAADYERGQVLILEDGGRQGAQPLAGRADGVSAPVAVEASTDGSVFVVNEESAMLVLIPSESSPSSFPCGCTATGLQRLKDPDSFRLTTGAGIQAVLQANGNQPGVFYVPAGEEAALDPAEGLAPTRTRR